jgi:hypothetical protein
VIRAARKRRIRRSTATAKRSGARRPGISGSISGPRYSLHSAESSGALEDFLGFVCVDRFEVVRQARDERVFSQHVERQAVQGNAEIAAPRTFGDAVRWQQRLDARGEFRRTGGGRGGHDRRRDRQTCVAFEQVDVAARERLGLAAGRATGDGNQRAVGGRIDRPPRVDVADARGGNIAARQRPKRSCATSGRWRQLCV